MEHLIPNKAKNPLINFYKAKLRKKELNNKSNNLIFANNSNQKILKTFKREIINDKNKLNQMKYKTSKNSPNSSLINNSNRYNKNDSKKDIIVNKINHNNYISGSKNKNKIKKEIFEEFFKKKMKKMYKKNTSTGGQISQRQKSIKNIFNNLRNDSSLNSSRLTKIKRTLYGNSNIYFNNQKINNQINNSNFIEDESKKERNTINKSGLNSINNSSLIPSSSSYRKIVVNNTSNKTKNNIFYNNFLNKQKNNNNANNEKGYIGNYNLMRHIENKYENYCNNDSHKNSINNKNLEEQILKKYKIKTKSKIIDKSSNSKIKKINPVDYLYNSKQKKENSKYTIKHLDIKRNNNEIASLEVNGSYPEINNQNKTDNLSKNNSNQNTVNKKRLQINENNNENYKYNLNNNDNNNEYNNDIINNNNQYNKTKISKENIRKMLNQDNNNIINIKGLSDFTNNNSLLSDNFLIKSSQLSSNFVNNNIHINKNNDINSLFNNEINNNSLLNISNNNNYNNINNQNININININNNSDNKNNNNYLNNNYIDINNINNYNKNISNISSNVIPINYINSKNEIIKNSLNNEININNNDIINHKKISLIPNNFMCSNSKNNIPKNEEYSNRKNINSDINNYKNLQSNNSNNQSSSTKAKLTKSNVQMNNFISQNKNNESNKKDNKPINNSKEKTNNDKKNIKNKNIILENNVYDININDFSPIYDEKNKNKDDNIQEKINKQNQLLHINKNNVSLVDNKTNKKNDINSNINSNCNKIKINKEDIKNKQNYHKYSQSQSLGKKAKDLNKKLINNINNMNMLRIKNNLLLENRNFFQNVSKSKIETKSSKEETSINNFLNINQNKKEKSNTHLLDLLDSKENSKEYIDKSHNFIKDKETDKEIEKEKEIKKNLFSKKIDIFSLKINNNIIDNNSNKNKNKNKIKETKELNNKNIIKQNDNKDNNNNNTNDMLYIPDSPELRKKEQDNIILTTMSKDCDYYKEELEKLSEYIKEYYNKNGKYPDSRIEFYLYGRQIGHGAFGKVNLALHIASGRLVAIKTFAKKHLKTKYSRHKIKNEINILSKLRHPFINQILDSFETEKHVFIIMEYVCGDLLGFIRKRGKLSESISKLVFKQVIEGLKYIHKKKIVHRDIKLDNILIDLTNTVKICDFGVSKKISIGDMMFDHCGTPAYIAPEIFGNKGYEGYQCDIWSAGVTLYYMLSGIQPFRANSIKDMEKIVLKGKFDEIEDVSKEANDLIKEMLQIDPKKRITIDNILKHPWLNNVDLENRKKLKLFTESEKILLSKFDVDYLSSSKDELIEDFSLKNLETNNNDTNCKNAGDTKSLIFAPYNSYIEESKDKKYNKKYMLEEEEIYKELKVYNNICKFGFKVQQANIKYELSNNNDFDNGIIKTQKEEDIKNQNEKIEKKYEEKMLNDKLSGLNTPRVRSANDSFEESEKIIIKKDIIKKIESDVGYDRKYIINSIRKNKINYATATYYLLSKEY